MRAYWRFASSSAVVDNRRNSDPPSRSIMNGIKYMCYKDQRATRSEYDILLSDRYWYLVLLIIKVSFGFGLPWILLINHFTHLTTKRGTS